MKSNSASLHCRALKRPNSKRGVAFPPAEMIDYDNCDGDDDDDDDDDDGGGGGGGGDDDDDDDDEN